MWVNTTSTTPNLASVLAQGNSAGTIDIDMNYNDINNIGYLNFNASTGTINNVKTVSMSTGSGSMIDMKNASLYDKTGSNGGTNNYLLRNDGNGTLKWNSAIRDNGTGIGIGISPSSTYKIYSPGGSIVGGYFSSDSEDGSRFYSYSTSTSDGAIYAYANSGARAGWFAGDVYISGNLIGGKGSFIIDHPDDPINKTLSHNAVESPENLCMYRGIVQINSNRTGSFKMPSYFKGLTNEKEATVSLTVIGKPFNVGYEWNSDFTEVLVYGEPNRKVSYIVLADRDDPVIRQLIKSVEETKSTNSICPKGKLLFPKAFGYSESYGVDYEKIKSLNH